MLHAEETMEHADSVFLGGEGRMEEVFSDFLKGQLKPLYNYLNEQPPIELVISTRYFET